jgi:hypothetical protein
VSCGASSVCYLIGNTIQDSAVAGISVSGSTTITGNGVNGVYLENGSFAGLISASSTGNLSETDITSAPQLPITYFVGRTGGVTNWQGAFQRRTARNVGIEFASS